MLEATTKQRRRSACQKLPWEDSWKLEFLGAHGPSRTVKKGIGKLTHRRGISKFSARGKGCNSSHSHCKEM
jgi:hypothetical protein